jgi:hypothetical protein
MVDGEFSGVLATMLSLEQQHSAAAAQSLEKILAGKETQQALDATSPDELLSCVHTQLDVREHQLSVLCILGNVACREKVSNAPASLLATELATLSFEFLASSRPTDFMASSPTWAKKLCAFCVRLGRVALEMASSNDNYRMDLAKASILPLCTALQCLLQGDLERITPLHSVLLEICVKTKCCTKAATLISPMPSLYDPERFETTLTDVLGYFLYGGDALLGLQRYEEALGMLTGAIVMPLPSRHELAMAALKKYVLVSLIIDGELRPMPPYTSPAVKKSLLQDIPDCFNLLQHAKALQFDKDADRSAQSLQRFIKDKHSTWEEDGNGGLAATIEANLYHRLTLKRYLKTYSVVPKEVLMKSLGVESPAELDAIVMKFAKPNQPLARIDDEAGVVRLEYCLTEESIPSMSSILELIQQTMAAKKAVDRDWLDIETSDLYRRQMLVNWGDRGRGERVKKAE